MNKTVRYGKGDNKILRFALWNIWNDTCYWCKKPTDFEQIEIDHIVPSSLGEQILRDAIADYRLPDDYDRDSLDNLAPICRPCNGPGEKGKIFELDQPLLARRLILARKRASAVEQSVNELSNSPVQAKALLKVAEMDLSTKKSKALFEKYAPAIVQKLGNINPEAADYYSYEVLQLELQQGDAHLEIYLDNRGRKARWVIDDLIGQPLEHVMSDVLEHLGRKVREIVLDACDGVEAAHSDAFATGFSLGPLGEGPRAVAVRSMDVTRDGGSVLFTLEGSYISDFSVGVAASSQDGGSLDEGYLSVGIDPEWEVTLFWDGQWDSLLRIEEVAILNNDGLITELYLPQSAS